MQNRRLMSFVVIALSQAEPGRPLECAEPTKAEPTIALLWPNGAPGAKGTADKDQPKLHVFLPSAEKANGLAVVVCPGGGYGNLAMGHEGSDIGHWLNDRGIAGFIVDYRHAGKGYGHPAPLQDAQRAVRMVRANAKQWNVDPQRVGVMGFSAGGHLASTVGTHFDKGQTDAADPIDRQSSRPDFLILCYPVISLDGPFTHAGSRKNLLGENPDEKLVQNLSNHLHVTAETPPTFLFHTGEDAAVPVENSLLFYSALRRAGVPTEMHIYQNGRHGVGLAADDPVLSSWPARCLDWLRTRKLLP